MNAVDDEAARNTQLVHENLQTGPWNTGVLGAKGAKVSEPLDTANPSNQDNVSRYTDRYLRHRVVGRTVEDFSFNPQFLPPELYRIVKLDSGEKAGAGAGAAGASGPSSSKDKLEQRIAGMVDAEDAKDEENVDEKDDEEEAAEEEVEDEFEEMDDDDYNAEKYFDDGDDYGDGDDGDNEAAY